VKIKCRPEDFRVDELTAVKPARTGAHGFYLLEKRGLSTFEAIGRIARHLGCPTRSINAGGLKDRHAVTRQHVSIAGKPVGHVKLAGLRLTPLGRLEAPFTGAELTGNRFAIVLRDVPPPMAATVAERARLAGRQGLPNYFDEQRFGSLRAGQGFIARRLIDGDIQGALRLHLGAPSRLDSSSDRARRQTVERKWGRWAELRGLLPRGNDRQLVDHLCAHPEDFAGAFELIEPRLAQLYVFAYQSFLWNGILGRMLGTTLDASALFTVPYAAGSLRFFDAVPRTELAALADLRIPLPCSQAVYATPELARAASDELKDEGLSLQDFQLRGLRRLRFRGGDRSALVHPGGLSVSAAQPDELHPGAVKVRLEFSLPPGSYATILVKFTGRDLLTGSRLSKRRGRRKKR
jgi:tRNA pseudouridine13 synthase